MLDLNGVLDSPMMPEEKCCVCDKTQVQVQEADKRDGLRHYGPEGAPICYTCSISTPELKAASDAQIQKAIEKLPTEILAVVTLLAMLKPRREDAN